MAAKTYINLHNSEYEFIEGSYIYVYLIDLVKEGLIDNNSYSSLDVVSCKIVSSKLECNIETLKKYILMLQLYILIPEIASVCLKEAADINVNGNVTSKFCS